MRHTRKKSWLGQCARRVAFVTSIIPNFVVGFGLRMDDGTDKPGISSTTPLVQLGRLSVHVGSLDDGVLAVVRGVLETLHAFWRGCPGCDVGGTEQQGSSSEAGQQGLSSDALSCSSTLSSPNQFEERDRLLRGFIDKDLETKGALDERLLRCLNKTGRRGASHPVEMDGPILDRICHIDLAHTQTLEAERVAYRLKRLYGELCGDLETQGNLVAAPPRNDDNDDRAARDDTA